MTVLIKIRLVFKSYTSKHHNKSNSFQIKLKGGNLHRGGGGYLDFGLLGREGGGLYAIVYDIEKLIALRFTLMKTCEFGHFISFLCRNDIDMYRKA